MGLRPKEAMIARLHQNSGKPVPLEQVLTFFSPWRKGTVVMVLPEEAKVTGKGSEEFKVSSKSIRGDCEEWYRDLFENASDLIQSVTPEGKFIIVNKAWEKTLGYSEEELDGLTVFDIVHPLYRETCRVDFKRVLRGENLENYKTVFISKQGREVILEGNISCRFQDGKPICTRGIFRDVSQISRSLEELQMAYLELNQIFNTAVDGMRVVDRDFTIIRVNQTFAAMFGLDADETKGKKCYQVTPGPHCHTELCPINQIRNGEEKVTREITKQIGDGTTAPFMILATPFKGPDDELVGIVEVFRDITERKRFEDKISYLAYHDYLTGLPNRLLFYDRLNMELARARRNEEMLAVMFLDLDRFKVINDTLGHVWGDEVLKTVANRLKKCVRHSDTVARLGGDEFVLLLPQIRSVNDATCIARKIIEMLREPIIINEHLCSVDGSIGISIYPHDGEDAETLITQADRAMYRSKELDQDYEFYI